MPDPNTAPPGLFRDLATLASIANTLEAQLMATGVAVEALPEADPVRASVVSLVEAGMVAVAEAPAFSRLRTYDPDYVEP